MSKKAVKHETTFIKCLKAPIRILGKARDLYVNSMTDCSSKMNYGSAIGPSQMLPRSFSTTSSGSNVNEDLRELVRAASQRGLKQKLELEIRQHKQASKKLPRSFTVGVGRIDEDKVLDSEENFKKKPEFLYPRSRSHAVPKRPNLYS